MRRRWYWVIPVLLLLFASCELYYKEPQQTGTLYLVSIGISYENTPDTLKGTVPDARELSAALEAHAEYAGWKVETTLLLQPQDEAVYASKANLELVLKDINDNATEHDLTIITYSGHGENETGNLVMADTAIVTPSWLHDRIVSIKGRKILIVDSCYSGNFVNESLFSSSWVTNKDIISYYEMYGTAGTYENPSFMVLTASADTDSYEREFGDHSHGIFTSALLEALGWDHNSLTIANGAPPATKGNSLTVDSLYTYIKKHQVLPVRWSLFTMGQNIQHPMVTGGAMDMVLFTY
ncbi:MAG: caspase family protein [Sphaerochaetaceae bacterium]